MIQTKTFDKLCEEILTPPFRDLGFNWAGGGTYARLGADGRDRIGLDLRPTRNRFCVMIGYYPPEFSILDELHPELDDSNQGFLCRPYLNPNCTSWHPKWWQAKDKETTSNSLRNVIECVQGAGVKWLCELRNPVFYAAQTDPVAALCSGYANELAGNTKIACERYLEMNRRFTEIERIGGGIRSCRQHWRDFLFVRAKLGINDQLTQEIQRLAGWSPNTTPLGS